MPGVAPQLDRFITRLHRRLVIVRVLERAGLGLWLGCGIALALMPILLWRGQSAALLAAAAPGAGALAGAAWGAVRRPTKLAAALEADRQLRWSDLIATALSLRQVPQTIPANGPAGGSADACADDPWAAAVVALAEARCAAQSPGAVLLNRWGRRAWGGAGLSAALVLAVALAAPDPAESRAAQAPRGAPIASDFFEAPKLPSPGDEATEAATDRRRPKSYGTADDPAQVASEPTAGPDSRPQVDSPDADKGDKKAGEPPAGGGKESGAASGEKGAAGGAGRTEATAATKLPSASGSAEAHGPKATPRPDSPVAAGQSAGGRGNNEATGTPPGEPAVTGRAGDSPPAGRGAEAPPWESKSWPEIRGAARAALRSGQVAPAYRDLVREYFGEKQGGGAGVKFE